MNFVFLKNLRLFWWPFIIFTTIITSLAVVQDVNWINIIYLSLSLCLVASFACLHNDILDQGCDKINKNNGRGHYIPSTDRKIINFLLGTLFILPLILSVLINVKALILVFVTIILLIIYNYSQYVSPLSVIISSTTSITPIMFPIILWSNTTLLNYILIIISILFLVIARETVADILDYEGDSKVGKKTLPVKIGKEHAYKLVLFITFSSIILLSVKVYLLFIDSEIFKILFLISFIIFVSLITVLNKKWTSKVNLQKYIKLTRFVSLFAPFLFFI